MVPEFMNNSVAILAVEAMAVYLLVLGAHALRLRFGMALFYALLGGITAITAVVTDAGLSVQMGGVKFMVGSTVFYTSLLMGAFVVYVFDGPGPMRVTILTVVGVSLLTALTLATVQWQGLTQRTPLPTPTLRGNVASVVTMVADLLFLAMAWEFLGRARRRVRMGVRAYFTLLGVLLLDMALFSAGAFGGTPDYLRILAGTFFSRVVISLFAFPFLYLYLRLERRQLGGQLEYRPVLAILQEANATRAELNLAQQEIQRRRQAEAEKETLIRELQASLARVKKLEGLLPVCSGCKQIRIESATPDAPARWVALEEYIRTQTEVEFSHGMCPNCLRRQYPELSEDEIAAATRGAEPPLSPPRRPMGASPA